jgi:hypothetical protein
VRFTVTPSRVVKQFLKGSPKKFSTGERIGKWAYWTRGVLNNYRARAFTQQVNWTPMTPGAAGFAEAVCGGRSMH